MNRTFAPVASVITFAITVAVALGTTFALPCAAQSRLETPAGGWRATDSAHAGFVQEVHYPASNVNVARAPTHAQIRGRIATSAKPATLVVDGVAMPLRQEEDGSFARPWSFGRGAHSVAVHAGDGRTTLRRQFVEAGARPPVKLRVVLSWDTDMSDLDLHVVSPDGQHVFYGDRLAANGAALDVDVTTGYGPEIVAAPVSIPGTWHVYVNYFGAGESQDALTIAQITVITDEGTTRETQRVVRVPMRKPGELTRVFSFVMP
jgi:uncharacterized protein YfaP (DUF2135 family)